MAYSDYGAFVYCNGERRRDKEDVALFATDEETFGESSENIPSGLRIWKSILHNAKSGRMYPDWAKQIHHGIMGDGNIRVMCHKQGLPIIYEATEDGISAVDFGSGNIDYCDYYDYKPIDFEYKGYKFHFESGSPYSAEMIEPDGTKWVCNYDYGYGAGFE